MCTERRWETNREQVRHGYRHRNPCDTALYRLVFHGYEELERVWSERFEEEYGRFRPEVRKAFEEYLNCGCFVSGLALLECQEPGCRHSRALSFSCKQRLLCPSCSAKRAVIFAEHLVEEVLKPVAHRHIVSSIPKRLRWAFKRDRSRLDMLFQSTRETIVELLVEACGDGRPGLVLTVQTAGEVLNFNPHCHGLLACGLFTAEGSFIPVSDFSAEKATKLFAHKVLSKMKSAGLIEQAAIDQIVSQRHSGFNVWFGDPIPPEDKDALHFVAQYIDRGPVERKRLEIIDDLVTYETERETWDGDPLEFLARLSCHLPGRYESVLRNFGEYSSRVRGARAKEERSREPAPENPQPLPILDEPDPKTVSKRWSTLTRVEALVNSD